MPQPVAAIRGQEETFAAQMRPPGEQTAEIDLQLVENKQTYPFGQACLSI